MSDEFLSQVSSLPLGIQKKTREMLDKLRAGQASAALHIEPLNGMKDERVRTARVDQQYRAVLVATGSHRDYVVVWVDNHDQAMAWAGRRRFGADPATGAFTVVNIANVKEAADAAHAVAKGGHVGAKRASTWATHDLAALGVEEALMPSVEQALANKRVNQLSKYLSEATLHSLLFLQEGIPLAEVLAEQASRSFGRSGKDDLSDAMSHPDTARRFVKLDDTMNLEQLLSGDFDRWRLFLHPDQKMLVEKEWNGPVRVLGGPGTGKTVVAMHRAVHLAKQVCKGDDKVLLTMFSKTLAADVRHQLERLCAALPKEVRERIEVKNIDAWAAEFLKSSGDPQRMTTRDQERELWREAYERTAPSGGHSLSRTFMRREWEQVVQTRGLQHFTEYSVAARPPSIEGKLGAKQRKEVWEVMKLYRTLLDEERLVEWPDLPRVATKRLKSEHKHPYRAVVVDEAQDFTLAKWQLVRQLAAERGNDLFLVGDEHQRIFGPQTLLKDAAINVRGRGKTLKVNYRTTRQIAAHALGLVEGVVLADLEKEEQQYLKRYIAPLSGEVPTVRWHKTIDASVKDVAHRVKQLVADKVDPKAICIITPSKTLNGQEIAKALERERVKFCEISNADNAQGGEGVRVCTMHRAKGLEFQHVLIAGVGDDRFPVPPAQEFRDEPDALLAHENQQRALLFVACTRARDTLYISGAGTRAEWIRDSVAD